MAKPLRRMMNEMIVQEEARWALEKKPMGPGQLKDSSIVKSQNTIWLNVPRVWFVDQSLSGILSD